MDPLPPWLTAFAEDVAHEYRVLRILGRGGMATVLLAEEPALKRQVAIKVLDPAMAQDPSNRTRFRREAEAAASLSHPHIVPIHRVGEAGGLPYFVMQHVRGESLGDRLAREGRLDTAEATRIAREIASALRAAHKGGIVHRDVKPQNVLLDAEDGRALVSDFGIARLLTSDAANEMATRETLTGVGSTMGTPRYMSPEQAGAQPVGPASDLYSLGVVMYEMLTGAFPYEDTPGRSAILQHLIDPVVPLTERTSDVPPALATITERLLRKEPSERFTTADDLLAAIDETVSGRSTPPAIAPGTPPRRTGRLVGALVAVVAIAGVAWLAARDRAPAEDPRHSLLVGYFENTSRDPALDWLRVGGIELLNRSLSRWDDLRLVETTRLLDLARRAELPEDAAISQSDALRLARDAGVGTVALGSVIRLGTDRSSVSLRLYDVRSGEPLRQVTEEVQADSLLPEAFARLADQVLSIAGAPSGAVPDDAPSTRSLVAFRAYVAGLRALHRFDTDSAQVALEAAVAADPTFALAWMRLGETLLFAEGPFSDSLPFVALLDSARRHVDGRPPRERLLVETAHHFVHARFAESRTAARSLLALDSLSVDGWHYLGLATMLDQRVLPDAAGRDSTGFDPTTAMRAFRRAKALDASNRQPYVFLSSLLYPMAVELPGQQPGVMSFARGRPESLRPRVDLPAVSYRIAMVSDDSIAFGPVAEMNARLTPEQAEASLARARDAFRSIIAPWLAVAPDAGMAHYGWSAVEEFEGDWAGALASYERAVELNAPLGPTPPDWERLRLGMLGRLDSVVLTTASRLEARIARGEEPIVREMPWLLGGLGAAQLLQGRVAEAHANRLRARARFDSLRATPRRRDLALYDDTVAAVQLRNASGRITAASAAENERSIQAALAQLPDTSARGPLSRFVPLGLPAATLGDTTRLARLRAALPPGSRGLYPGLNALAAAVAGDRAAAERAVRAAETDTLFPWPGSAFSAGQAALMIGEPARALRLFTRVDSSAFNLGTTLVDPDWIFVTRAAKGRGDAALALGDTARARREYERVLRLWRDADPALHPERDDAAMRLDQLRNSDRVRTIPVVPPR